MTGGATHLSPTKGTIEMAKEVKRTINNSIKDKLKLSHGILLLLSYLVTQVPILEMTQLPITKLVLIIYIGGLLFISMKEENRHKETTQDYPTAVQIVDEIRYWVSKIVTENGDIDTKTADNDTSVSLYHHKDDRVR